MSDQMTRDLARFNTAWQRKTQVMNVYREAFGFAVQHRDTFGHITEGTKSQYSYDVFDSTTGIATGKFVSNLQSSLVPPMKTWIKQVPGEAVPENNRQQAAKDLNQINDSMFRSLQNSNFDTQIAESFYDLAVGTGALLVQKGTKSNPFLFTAVPMEQLAIDEVADSRIGAVFRKHSVHVRSLQEVWPDAMMSPELNEALENTPDQKVALIEMVMPEKVKVLEQSPTGRMRFVEVDGYRYTVVMEKDNHRLVQREQRSSPWVIFRWSVLPGEVWGRGPLLAAMPDVKTLNKTKELTLKNAAMAIAGAWTVVDDGIVNVNTIKIYPGALIPVGSNGGGQEGASIRRLDMAGNFDVSQIIIKELQQAINDVLFADPLGPIDLPVKSATEVSIRQQALAQRIGSAFGRLQFELIVPLVNRLLNIMEELGLADLQNYRVDGQVIAIQHISPLAQAQDEESLTSLVRYAQLMVNTFGPQLALLMIDPQVFGENAGKLLNVPPELLPSKEQWQAIKNNVVSFGARLAQQQTGAAAPSQQAA